VRSYRRVSLSLLAGVFAVGCARSLPPPGGDRDETPPEVIATTPQEHEVITELNRPVVFRFDERISERGATESILVSPLTGEPRVKRGRSEIRVEMPGGWKPDQVYTIVLLPGLRDLFGNERREPASLVFSTGPPVPSTAIAGIVLDRLTGRPANQVVVQASKRADSVVYTTVGDSAAFFALTNLPAGIYDVTAFVDQNRNRRRDPSEAFGRGPVIPLNTDRDTMALVLQVVPADTTPPRLARAEGRDTMEVRVIFDDYLDPDTPLESIQISLFALPDTTPVAGAPELMRVDTFEARVRAREDSLRAREDSLRADTVAADTARPQPVPSPPGRQGAPRRQDRDTTAGPLPERELVLIPAIPLARESKYLLRVEGATNVTGLSGGGGTAEFEIPARAATSAPARPDTTQLPEADRRRPRPPP
jgi:hypothetical protein